MSRLAPNQMNRQNSNTRNSGNTNTRQQRPTYVPRVVPRPRIPDNAVFESAEQRSRCDNFFNRNGSIDTRGNPCVGYPSGRLTEQLIHCPFVISSLRDCNFSERLNDDVNSSIILMKARDTASLLSALIALDNHYTKLQHDPSYLILDPSIPRIQIKTQTKKNSNNRNRVIDHHDERVTSSYDVDTTLNHGFIVDHYSQGAQEAQETAIIEPLHNEGGCCEKMHHQATEQTRIHERLFVPDYNQQTIYASVQKIDGGRLASLMVVSKNVNVLASRLGIKDDNASKMVSLYGHLVTGRMSGNLTRRSRNSHKVRESNRLEHGSVVIITLRDFESIIDNVDIIERIQDKDITTLVLDGTIDIHDEADDQTNIFFDHRTDRHTYDDVQQDGDLIDQLNVQFTSEDITGL